MTASTVSAPSIPCRMKHGLYDLSNDPLSPPSFPCNPSLGCFWGVLTTWNGSLIRALCIQPPLSPRGQHTDSIASDTVPRAPAPEYGEAKLCKDLNTSLFFSFFFPPQYILNPHL